MQGAGKDPSLVVALVIYSSAVVVAQIWASHLGAYARVDKVVLAFTDMICLLVSTFRLKKHSPKVPETIYQVVREPA